MPLPPFFQIELRCPCCMSTSFYFDMPDVTCDYCSFEIRLKGELQTCPKGFRRSYDW